ncbi:hypothetical protein AAG906_021216 [Vitis piasezkii]
MVINFILVTDSSYSPSIWVNFLLVFNWIHFEAMLGHVIRCTSTIEIWSTLHEVFGIQSKYVVVNITSKDHITLQHVIAHYATKLNSFNFGYNRAMTITVDSLVVSRGGGGEGNQSKNKPIYQCGNTDT